MKWHAIGNLPWKTAADNKDHKSAETQLEKNTQFLVNKSGKNY